MRTTSLFAIAATVLLTACGGGSDGTDPVDNDPVIPTDNDVTANADGSFTVEDAGETFELSNATFTSNGQIAWFSGNERGASFINDDVTVIGAVVDGDPFSGVTGTTSAGPTGDAVFTGGYTVVTASSSVGAGVVMNYSLSTNRLTTATGSDLILNAAVGSEGALNGTVVFDGETAPLSGGFYGTNTVAGAFDNSTIAGVFYGTN